MEVERKIRQEKEEKMRIARKLEEDRIRQESTPLKLSIPSDIYTPTVSTPSTPTSTLLKDKLPADILAAKEEKRLKLIADRQARKKKEEENKHSDVPQLDYGSSSKKNHPRVACLLNPFESPRMVTPRKITPKESRVSSSKKVLSPQKPGTCLTPHSLKKVVETDDADSMPHYLTTTVAFERWKITDDGTALKPESITPNGTKRFFASSPSSKSKNVGNGDDRRDQNPKPKEREKIWWPVSI